MSENKTSENNTIVWLSRHAPQAAQKKELRDAGFTNIIQVSQTFASGKDAWEAAVAANGGNAPDAVMAVLPLPMLAEMLHMAGDTPVIRAVMNRTMHDDGTVTFEHDHFDRVLKVAVATEPFPKAAGNTSESRTFEVGIRGVAFFHYDGKVLVVGEHGTPRKATVQEALDALVAFSEGYACGFATTDDNWRPADAYVDGVCYENEAFVGVFKKAYNI